MAKQDPKTNKVETPAPGAEGATEKVEIKQDDFLNSDATNGVDPSLQANQDAEMKAQGESQENKEAADKAVAKEPSVFKVKSEFRDKDNFDLIHKVSDDVSHFDNSRLEDLVNRGLVTKA